MEEQKRLFIAIILSVVVIAGWNLFFVDSATMNQQPPAETSTAEGPSTDDQGPAVADFKSDAGSTAQFGTPQTTVPPSGDKVFKTLSLSTPLYHVEISEKQAALTSLSLNNYRESMDEDSPQKEMIPSSLPSGLYGCGMEGKSIPGFETAVFTADTEALQSVLNDGEKKISFFWRSPHGIEVEKIYTFFADTYLIGLDIVIKNGATMPLKDRVEIQLPFAISKNAASMARFGVYGPAAFVNGKLESVKPDDIEEKNTLQGTIDWVGNEGRYFLSALVLKTPGEATVKLAKSDTLVMTTYLQDMERLDPGKQITFSYQCYMGPKSLKVLGQFDSTLKKAINFGWFDVLAKPCLIGMNLIHDIIPNYGVAIILLTILIKLIFWPLGTKSYRSMNDMKKLQPLMMEIREKYKDDKQRMNQEVMSLYKTYKVNPMSGCLPMVVQMPIFFALYRMLYQAIELRHAPFLGWINDLSAPDRLFHFDVTIPFMQPPYGIPVLTLIMGATMFLQQKMSPSTGDPTQAKMMMFMPLFMTVIFINFPAGLVLYWLVNNVLSIGQQYYIQKKFS